MAAPHCCGILLGSNGIISTYANVTGDPDGTDDPIAHLEKTGQD
jgi:hypothetical protein